MRNWNSFSLFLNQNICSGYSKEPSHRDGSFEHRKHMFKLMDKKIIAILRYCFLLNLSYATFMRTQLCWTCIKRMRSLIQPLFKELETHEYSKSTDNFTWIRRLVCVRLIINLRHLILFSCSVPIFSHYFSFQKELKQKNSFYFRIRTKIGFSAPVHFSWLKENTARALR